MPWVSIPIKDRFWPKVDKRGPDACWPWLAAKDKDGYGVIGFNSVIKVIKAHRFVLELKLGRPIKSGYCSCHACDNPSCQYCISCIKLGKTWKHL